MQSLSHLLGHRFELGRTAGKSNSSRRKFCFQKTMKVIAAYMLARLGGNEEPTADDIKRILGSVCAEAEDDKIELLLSQVKGKDITELVASGREKLASVPSGGGAPMAVAASGGGAPAAAPAAAEAKKEEKVEEEDSEEEMGLGGGLFGFDD
ncbi:60S acidic ribosomal protein P2 [Thalictrum thalictroides]|uniref:60S acidic ribosomal protein P2 n=1 Tax=Thalictrum thalictroides TaxID=46969 RepID=A0A7J6VW13_THATH|nr:60S acidic ribosomal protein P2 [Thalictrum thalictroides]